MVAGLGVPIFRVFTVWTHTPYYLKALIIPGPDTLVFIVPVHLCY